MKFAVFCVIDYPGRICGWNIDISSESKWYVIDFVSKLAVSGARVHFIDVSDVIDYCRRISRKEYEVSEWDWKWWLQRSEFCEWILAIEW